MRGIGGHDTTRARADTIGLTPWGPTKLSDNLTNMALRPHPAPLPAAATLGRATLADRQAALLATQIERGRLAPGDRLPTEAQLCATHGV